ncbi:hypothetical protein JCM10212_002534 [Sporobolomyces blumeae]
MRSLSPSSLLSLVPLWLAATTAVAVSARPNFKPRNPKVKVSVPGAATTPEPLCTPSSDLDAVYNLFAKGNGSAAWEWIPDSVHDEDEQGTTLSGGTVFVSGTDSPEDGAYYLIPVASVANSTSTSTFRLSLADHAKACSSTGSKTGDSCSIRTRAGPQCAAWLARGESIPGVPGYGPVGLAMCRRGNEWQSWDVVRA